ncbi:MAG: GntR family transcriptional regulator [Reinekea sp.]
MSLNVSKLTNDLKRKILTGELNPGEALRQEDIAGRYQISRMPVREALKELQSLGLVDFIPNKGAFVAKLDLLEFRENVEMRASAEGLALKLAIPELSNRQIETATQINEELRTCALSEFSNKNREFHSALYLPCNRPRLLAHIEILNDIADRYLQYAVTYPDQQDTTYNEHKQILKACGDRNMALAEDILYRHITAIGELIEKSLQSDEVTK